MLRGITWLFHYTISLLRVITVLVVALFLPQMFIWHSQHVQQPFAPATATSFKLGIENISETLANSLSVEGAQTCRVGLITNQTGTDQAGNRNIEILVNKGFSVNKVFLPSPSNTDKTVQASRESIINGNKMIPIVPVALEAGHMVFTDSVLKDIDVLMFDMQDVGMRHYGYVSTLLNAMHAACAYQKKFIVLDRPNLLGWCMEGACGIDPQHIEENVPDNTMQIPMRHGMTIGELATYFNKHMLDKPVDLQVIPMAHYNRQNEARKPLLCGLSQNIATLDACYGYSFLGLLGEVHPFEIGIGTDKAFQCLLLPESMKFSKQKWHDLRMVLKEQGIESKFHRCFSQRKNQYCSGLRLYIQDINRFSSFNTLISVLKFFKDSGIMLTYSDRFDQSVGTKKFRCLLDGTISHSELALEVNGELQSFFKKAFNCFLYKPFPKMIHV